MAECDWIILCDYAFLGEKGKLGMVGVFDSIIGETLPYTHDRASVCFYLVGEPGEDVKMKLKIIGPNAEEIVKADVGFTLPDFGSAQGRIEVRNLELKDYGRYAIEVDCGETPKTAWFTLRQPPAR